MIIMTFKLENAAKVDNRTIKSHTLLVDHKEIRGTAPLGNPKEAQIPGRREATAVLHPQ